MPEKLELAGKKVEIEYSVTGKSALIFNLVPEFSRKIQKSQAGKILISFKIRISGINWKILS